MTDGANNALPEQSLAAIATAETYASQMLTAVAARAPMAALTLDEVLLRRLESALLEYETAARHIVVEEFRAAGVNWDEIVDHYIPAAARRLGEMWCADEVSFAEVTIGVARLQSMLRDCAPEVRAERREDPNAPNVLLIVRQDDFHTLGAMVAAGQLRRRGLSVRLSLGQPDSAVIEIIGTRSFDAILISASSSERLESVEDLIKSIRMCTEPVAPIVLGGTILDTDRDVRALTGADFTTSDAEEALRLCGLHPRHRNGGTRESRG